MSAVKHNLTIVRPCHRCIATIKDFETMDKRDVRHRSQTAYVRNIVASCRKDIETFEKNGNVSQVRAKKKEIEAILKVYSLAS